MITQSNRFLKVREAALNVADGLFARLAPPVGVRIDLDRELRKFGLHAVALSGDRRVIDVRHRDDTDRIEFFVGNSAFRDDKLPDFGR
jgi:hypothetical protein